MVYFLITIFYISFITSVVYFNKKIKNQNNYIKLLIKQKSKSTANIQKLIEKKKKKKKKIKNKAKSSLKKIKNEFT